MEIYIDNEKIELGKKNRKNFEKIIKAITKRLEQNEKIIRNIYINGNILEESTIIDMTEPNILEVETKSYVDLIIESLSNCKNYIETFFEIMAYLNFKIESNQKILKEDIDEFHSFLMWFEDLLSLIEETYSFGENRLFFELIEDINNKLQMLTDKRKKKAYVEYINILETEISGILDEFYNNVDIYYQMILEEEKKKKLVS